MNNLVGDVQASPKDFYRYALVFIGAFMVVCIFDKGVKGQCLSFNLVPNFVF